MANNEKNIPEEESQPKKFTLYNVKMYQTKKDENNFLVIKNYVSEREKNDDLYDILNENEQKIEGNITYSGVKYLKKEELDAIDLEYIKGGMYNLTFEVEGKEEKLIAYQKVKRWYDIVKLNMSDIRYTAQKKRPFVVLYHAVNEENFNKAPNKTDFVEGMKELGLYSEKLEAYNGWINFSTFIWMFPNEIEKYNAYQKNKSTHWTLQYEQIDDTDIKIKKVLKPTFEKDLLVQGKLTGINDNKEVEVTLNDTWGNLMDKNLIPLINLCETTSEEDKTLTIKVRMKISEEIHAKEGDDVEFFLNDVNVRKLKSTNISLQTLERAPENDITKIVEEPEEPEEPEIPEIEIDEDEIPF